MGSFRFYHLATFSTAQTILPVALQTFHSKMYDDILSKVSTVTVVPTVEMLVFVMRQSSEPLYLCCSVAPLLRCIVCVAVATNYDLGGTPLCASK